MTFREDESSEHRAPLSDDTQRMLPSDLVQLADLTDMAYRQGLSPDDLRAKDLKLQSALNGNLPTKEAQLASRARAMIKMTLDKKPNA